MTEFTGPPRSDILILTEIPETVDIISGRPFAGPNGRLLKGLINNAFLSKGSSSNDVNLGYVIPNKPYQSMESIRELYGQPKPRLQPAPELLEATKALQAKIEKTQPKIIVAVGEEVFHFLTGYKDFSRLRGYTIEVPGLMDRTVKVIGTYDMSRLIYQDYLRYVAIMDFKKALAESVSEKVIFEERHVEPDATPEEFIKYCFWLASDEPDDSFPLREDLETGIAIDIENLRSHGSHITQIGIGHSDRFAMTLNLGKRFHTISEHQEAEITQALYHLSRCKRKTIFHNGIHDISLMFKNMGVLFRNDFDTMIAGQNLWPEFPKGLEFLSSMCLNVRPWKHLDGEDTYNAEDVLNTKALGDAFNILLDQRGLREIFEFEMSQVPLAAMLQLQGVKVDKEVQKQMEKDFTEKKAELLAKLHTEIEKATGVKQQVNLNSPAQVKKLLYTDMGLPPQYKRRKSVREVQKETTDEEALIKLSRKTKSPVPQLLIDYKKTSKAISSYIDFKTSPWGTVHTSYNIGSSVEKFGSKKSKGEDSRSLGRWSSSSSIIFPYGPGNMQSIPKYARKMFVPFEEGWEMACGDFVQAEAVIVAYLSRDEPLIEAIEKGNKLRAELRGGVTPEREEQIRHELQLVDMHRLKVQDIMGVPLLEVTKEQRQIGKIVRHATNYRAGPAVAQSQAAAIKIHKEISYWKQLLETDMQKSPYKSRWHKHVEHTLPKNNRTMKNCFGRVRRFLTGMTPETLKDLITRALAFEPQSTIGDLMNKALVKFYNLHADQIRILLQLHDGGYISYPKEQRDIWIPRLRECMEIPITIEDIYGDKHEIVVDIEFEAGPSWGELEEINY